MRSATPPAPSTHTPSSFQPGSRLRQQNPVSSGAVSNSSTKNSSISDSRGLTTGSLHSPGNGGRVKRSGAIQRANEHLAYCGEYNAADAEFARLDPYRPGLSLNQCAEIDNQRRFVGDLRAREARARRVSTSPADLRNTVRKKIGRNALCPCGSGHKYKRCHG
jgi:SEC-C motif